MNTDNRRGRAVSLPDLFDDSLETAFDDDFEDGFSLSDDELDDFLSTAAPAAAHSRSAVTREVEQPAPAEERPARSPRRLPLWAAFVIDAVLVGCSLLVFALFHHVIPQRNISTQPPVQLVTDTADGFVSPTDTVSQSDAVSETDVLPAPFTEEVVSTETGYSSPNVAITMTTGRYENADYYIQDIQLRDISLFRTAFAEDTYGLWVVDFTPEIARQHNAICAINGDYYGASRVKGVVVRNGTVYRGNGNDRDDILALYQDGTMEVIPAAGYDEESFMSRPVWQAWSFGPSLLNADGSKIDYFKSEISGTHPRTVVGYYEPGHYCFITVDGRSKKSAGLTFVDLSALCESLGLKIAYNLDGGRTSMMTFGDTLVNDAYLGGRECSDILYICDSVPSLGNEAQEGVTP